jgi:hypothetical protein
MNVGSFFLNISPKTVQAWEQGSRKPSEAALKPKIPATAFSHNRDSAILAS